MSKLDPVDVQDHYDNSVGSGGAASEGVITPQLIADRPLLRPGNLFNTRTTDIACFYTSRLQGDPAKRVDDIHFHPGEKRSFRVTLSYNF